MNHITSKSLRKLIEILVNNGWGTKEECAIHFHVPLEDVKALFSTVPCEYLGHFSVMQLADDEEGDIA